MIDAYLNQVEVVDTRVQPVFVDLVNKALRGLETVCLTTEQLLAALQVGGLPCTPEDLEQRFRSLVRTAMHGHDQRNTRLTIEQSLPIE